MIRAALSCAWAGLVLVAATLPVAAQSAPSSRRTAALPGTAEGGWREFRGDPRNLGVSHGKAPTFSGVRWRFLADSEIVNSPAVDGGVVVFGSRGGHLYCVRCRDGTKVWEKPLAVPAAEEGDKPSDRPSGFSFSSPLIDAGRITLGAEDGFVYCASLATGDLLWKRDLSELGGDPRVWSSPKTDGRRVYVGSMSKSFWALDAATGEVAWKTPLASEIGSAAGLIGGDVVVSAKENKIFVLEAATGAIRSRIEIPGGSFSAPALHLGFAYVRAPGGRVLGVDLVSGGVGWTAPLSPTSHDKSSLAADGGMIYALNAALVAAVDDRTGEPRWDFRAGGSFDASPIVVGGWIVAAGSDRTLHVLDKKSGAKVKQLVLGEKLIATPAIVDGVAYVAGTSGTLFAVE